MPQIKYKIRVEKITEPIEPDKYEKTEYVYEQVLENVNLKEIIKAVNGFKDNGN